MNNKEVRKTLETMKKMIEKGERFESVNIDSTFFMLKEGISVEVVYYESSDTYFINFLINNKIFSSTLGDAIKDLSYTFAEVNK
jgi:hypothetical protein